MTKRDFAVATADLDLVAEILPNSLGYSVQVRSRNNGLLDRPVVYAWGLGPKHAALATRLAAYLNSGRAFKPVSEVRYDVGGKRYADVPMMVFLIGRRLNADLRRLGF